MVKDPASGTSLWIEQESLRVDRTSASFVHSSQRPGEGRSYDAESKQRRVFNVAFVVLLRGRRNEIIALVVR